MLAYLDPSQFSRSTGYQPNYQQISNRPGSGRAAYVSSERFETIAVAAGDSAG